MYALTCEHNVDMHGSAYPFPVLFWDCCKIGCMMYRRVCDVQGGTWCIRIIRNFTKIK